MAYGHSHHSTLWLTIVSALVVAGCALALAACGALPTPPRTEVPEPNATSAPRPKATATPVDVAAAATPPLASGEVRRPAPGGPLSPFVTDDFLGPGTCALCHSFLTDRSGANVSMITAWRSTMMAHAAIDPVWQAKVSAEVARQPELQAVIEEKCVTCHMPMAQTQAKVAGQPVAALGEGFANRAHPLHAVAIDGVSCTLCHQVTERNLGEPAGFSGGYVIDTATNPPDRRIYGPYENPLIPQMRAHTGYIPTYGEHMLSAEHCATCHNLYTPYVDASGTVLGEFPEQTPYTEWLHSAYAGETVSCQRCHMPLAEGAVVISQMPRRLAARQPFFQHWFVGGNRFMLQILADWGADLEVTAEQAELRTTIDRVEAQVTERTAQMSVVDVALADQVLTARVRVETLTGHKFPTSFPSRRAWLHVTVTDAAGQVVFESGRPGADGRIAGNAADGDPLAYEPHYDVITAGDQVQIYEPIMANSDGEVTYTLLRAASYVKDNRLLPRGADKAALPADIAVFGVARDDATFVGGSDEVTYRVDVGSAVGPFTVEAALLYETLSYRFVQDLLAEGTELTERFGGYYALADKTPLVVATASQRSD